MAASLVQDFGIAVYAIRGEDTDTYYKHIVAALEHEPHRDHGRRRRPRSAPWSSSPWIGSTTSHAPVRDMGQEAEAGRAQDASSARSSAAWKRRPPASIRLRAMEKDGVLQFPVIAVNDAQTKHFFDNRYGTGQSTIDGIIRATNMLMAGRKIVVCGYGWCGKGVALRARGLGAQVIVTESRSDPRPGSGDGRVQRHADGRGGPGRRHLHHRHRQHAA